MLQTAYTKGYINTQRILGVIEDRTRVEQRIGEKGEEFIDLQEGGFNPACAASVSWLKQERIISYLYRSICGKLVKGNKIYRFEVPERAFEAERPASCS